MHPCPGIHSPVLWLVELRPTGASGEIRTRIADLRGRSLAVGRRTRLVGTVGFEPTVSSVQRRRGRPSSPMSHHGQLGRIRTFISGFGARCDLPFHHELVECPARLKLASSAWKAEALSLDDGHEWLGRQESNLHLPGNSRAPSRFGHIPMVAGTGVAPVSPAHEAGVKLLHHPAAVGLGRSGRIRTSTRGVGARVTAVVLPT